LLVNAKLLCNLADSTGLFQDAGNIHVDFLRKIWKRVRLIGDIGKTAQPSKCLEISEFTFLPESHFLKFTTAACGPATLGTENVARRAPIAPCRSRIYFAGGESTVIVAQYRRK
jgi:hypothetical protein